MTLGQWNLRAVDEKMPPVHWSFRQVAAPDCQFAILPTSIKPTCFVYGVRKLCNRIYDQVRGSAKSTLRERCSTARLRYAIAERLLCVLKYEVFTNMKRSPRF